MGQRSYAILGTGAVGGFYGACLQRAGLPVHFLLRSDYAHVREHGLVIDSVAGDFHLPEVKAYSKVTAMPPCDVVIIGLKTTQNSLLASLLPPLLNEDSLVLVLQNGLGNEAEVAQIVPADRVLGGLCFICANKVGPGHIRHLGYGTVTLGQRAPGQIAAGISSSMTAIAADFRQAGLCVNLAEDLPLARWHKLVWNIPFNGLSVVLDASTRDLMAASRTLVEALMQEVVLAAGACGRTISDNFLEQMLEHTARMEPYSTSMKLDAAAGRPLELEAIFGVPLRIARQAGIELPRIAMLYDQLRFLEAQHNHTAP
ncbi:putative 2-dehydropantoate 2-reductase [Anthocerotibacter panamensis]|uniref:putative 2-dehydropantoate 2-reductase n=1 Tax=Anthocerotibacter panamensis TaxID=2857077 RepID=UPI001C4067B1|nr:putative 2-dehydropantoate 2-reductase [Anthocerotibacter panamensis]